ncbi:MAG: NgoPII restriction endonuclease [candidate division WS6 bacterium OLB20]|uniref:NgoPII restriction endonuclease n=1 Tax=candidate division WS6 bacterium OLB20 TaxID=1617426 RepID=A0A136LYY4_9BACT|nr:MAG: NgoPII restriction endonuclease [candidate division WS6 bacterium OLB20]
MNILNALINLSKRDTYKIDELYEGNNRINNVGDALEYFIKDGFINEEVSSNEQRDKKYSEAFSYLGNSSNPPDFMLRGGDAFEVKKGKTHYL